MKTVILAGGKGTRLRPYTTVFPKPLMPIGHRPILDIIIQQLSRHGFKDIVLSVGYLSELIQAYFDNVSSRLNDVKLTYVKEDKPTGTAGSLASISGLDEPFMVMNGDVLTTLDYSKLVDYHHRKGGILTIGMYKKHVKIDLGVVEMDGDGTLTGYVEKPEKIYDVSMGIYVYDPAVLSYIDQGEHLDFPDLVLRLLEHGEKVVGYPFDGHWLDIGREEDYFQAQKKFGEMQHLFLPPEKVLI